MQITQAALQSAFLAFDMRYQQAYGAAQPVYQRYTMEVPSSTREQRYGWMAKIPRLREWVGERVVQNASAHDYSIVNKDFELTMEVDRNDFEDDQLGLFNPTLDMMGQQARLYPQDLVNQALKDGETKVAYDGQYFFDTDHPIDLKNTGAGTQSNLFTGTALTADNYATVRATMMTWKGEDTRALGIMPNLLVVPPQLEVVAKKLVNADLTTGGETNVLKGTAEVLVVPELASAPGDWYLMDVSKPIKPFVFQNRKAPVFTYLNQPTSENVFWHKKFVYGVDARGAAGYGLWFLAAKAKA